MEFWGVEVKAGEPLKVVPEESSVIHLSQATLGELKKGGDQCAIHVKVGNQKLVLANLSSDKMPQIPFDLVFDKEFELSHSLKSGSVHFCGYQSCLADSAATESDEEDQSVFTDSEEDPLLNFTDNGNDVAAKPAPPKTNAVKPESSGKQKVNIVEPIKDEDDSDDSDDIDGSSDDDDDTSSDEDMLGADSSDEDDDDSEEEEDTPTPKKNPKKRPNESAPKTPVSAKKAKQVTPQKTDGKKGAHTATPHPAKKGGKTSATSDKSKPQTPKSAGGDHSCKPCNKSFNSDGALSSHKKAKHSAK